MLDGKSIIVTGGARGVGEAIALKCLSLGARVGVLYFRSKARAGMLHQTLHIPTRVVLLEADVRDEGGGHGPVSRNSFRLGDGLTDWLTMREWLSTRLLAKIISRSGTAFRLMSPIQNLTRDDSLCSRAALSTMWRQRSGSSK